MTPQLYYIFMRCLWILGTSCAALCLGLCLLQLFIFWILGEPFKETQNRPLIFHHRHARYPEELLEKHFNPNQGKAGRHAQLREIFHTREKEVERMIDKFFDTLDEKEKK